MIFERPRVGVDPLCVSAPCTKIRPNTVEVSYPPLGGPSIKAVSRCKAVKIAWRDWGIALIRWGESGGFSQ